MRRGWFFVLTAVLTAGVLWAADPAALAEQGKKMFDKGDYNKALQIFLRLKKEDPSHPFPKEYINKCQDKIVEAEKEMRMKKAKEEGANASDVFAPTEPAPSWTAPSQRKLNPAKKKPKKVKTKKRTSYSTPAGIYQKEKRPSALLVQQQALTEGYRNKILEGKAIEIKRSGHKVDVVAFMSRLFLPFSDVLAPDAVPAIETVARELALDPGRTTTLRAVDSITPAVRQQMLDLPARRVSILFSYFVHAAVSGEMGGDRLTFSAKDLDD
jgi:hypothetical protein